MLRIDYGNCLAGAVGGHGLDAGSLAPGSESDRLAEALCERLDAVRTTGWTRWRGLPYEPMRSEHLDAVLPLVDRLKGRFDNLIVLGIGGSALGNIALQSALNPPTWNLLPDAQRGGPRLFVLDNVDPVAVARTIRFVESSGGWERTLVNVVSKSGETAETAAQFMILREKLIAALGEAEHAGHVVAITDPERGTMRRLCDSAGYATLPVPDGVGGRFSVLSPVGLFSAAMCGIDVSAMLAGAQVMDDRCSSAQLGRNPAAMLATILVRLGLERGKTNHVMMPYANALYLMADWFRQLWAESLGKRVNDAGEEVFAGFTPIKALGARDQHSQVQLYREGPNDKVIALLAVEEFGEDVAIPAGLGVDSLAYLEGSSLAQLLDAERRATAYALTQSQRPNLTITFPRIDARHIGEFIQLWQMTTAYAGLMLGIDAYDQPAVELGKQATFGLMGRAGYEEWAGKVSGGSSGSHVV
ncbi:MAG: glucose-6-phosphate isomerase [Phycisphaeraceae bacterium]|nr:glucose-6-phosphate isomerase [Phycisphaeraceae bacterium]MCB9847989.1 glucose-6-phosphate isomerase [Phycisphaeraceae bacterium]